MRLNPICSKVFIKSIFRHSNFVYAKLIGPLLKQFSNTELLHLTRQVGFPKISSINRSAMNASGLSETECFSTPILFTAFINIKDKRLPH